MRRICIITPGVGRYSETFIESHVRYLQGEKFVVTINAGMWADQHGKFLGNHDMISRFVRWFRRAVFADTFQSQQTSILGRYLLANKIEHALIEYGTTAKKSYSACVLANVPFTVHFHGYDAYVKDYASHDYYGDVFKHAHAIVVVSRHMQDHLMALGAPVHKLRHIPYGTDFKRTSGLIPQSNRKKFLAVGRLVEKKAPNLTILAFAEALKSIPDLHLTIVGDGPLSNICRTIIYGLKLDRNVSMVGALDHEAVRVLMEACHVFIQHSITASNGDSEGLPVAIVEALAIHKPVIATKHSGIIDVVLNAKNGFLSDEGDVQAMAQNILTASNGFAFDFSTTQPLILKEQIKKLDAVFAHIKVKN